ncbi:PHP domain-containing protein [Candidatus Acetothermia bacterium]|jgi:PHP family Zn ribbon phosphoesterase|nr:PHP domain-containing protein [Candidatus Acetothermia bacterium]MCI2427239.1 PHP domain-containing protein [Candidatus Acetothermia bacterium]MCI2428751.1 PHP domain-containing protein [Candidatus Acetothermia bacterium]
MFQYVLADLHIHTVLSPCAEVEMIPPLIIRRARELGLGLIGITDHNSAENVAAVIEAAQGSGITVLPGIEVQTREEVHVVTLFDTAQQALVWQMEVFNHLPNLKNNEDHFGAQFVVDASGEYIRRNERLLATSTDMSLEMVVAMVQDLGGLALPAHVDRPSFSLLANLGFVPPDLDLPAVEILCSSQESEVRQRFPQIRGFTMVSSGDAHRLSEMVARTIFKIAAPTVAELVLAMRGEDGRWVEIY